MKTVALIASGQMDSAESLRSSILSHKRVIAVDGGLVFCQNLNITPHRIVGDFDSCPADVLKAYTHVPHITLQRDKDLTDLEAAIQKEFEEGAEKLTLFGALGGRIDHSMVNLLLLTRHPGKIWIETDQETLFAIDKKVSLPCRIGQTLSLIPLNGPVSGITTQGLKWELKNGKLDKDFVGVSNICLKETVDISVKKGSLICCILKN